VTEPIAFSVWDDSRGIALSLRGLSADCQRLALPPDPIPATHELTSWTLMGNTQFALALLCAADLA